MPLAAMRASHIDGSFVVSALILERYQSAVRSLPGVVVPREAIAEEGLHLLSLT